MYYSKILVAVCLGHHRCKSELTLLKHLLRLRLCLMEFFQPGFVWFL